MPKSILLPTAVAGAVLLLGSACGSASDNADTSAKESSRSAAAEPGREKASKDAERDDQDAKSDDAGEQTGDRDAAKDKASRDKDAHSKPATDSDEAPAEEKDADGDDSGDTEPKTGPDGTLTVTGGPFSTLSFPSVQCSSDGSDLYLQSRSEDPAAVLTVLFSGGAAAHASLQTAPESGESMTWSDEDSEAMAASVRREDDTVTLTNAVLKPFGDDSELTVSGSLTCNEEL